MRTGSRLLTENDFAAVLELERKLTDDVTVVIQSTDEEILKCLRSKMSVGIFVESTTLVSYSLCYGDDYNYTAFIEKCVTKEGFGGFGYQSLTIDFCKMHARLRLFSQCAAMVSPKNERSVYNFKKSGFSVVRTLYNVFGSINERYLMECKL